MNTFGRNFKVEIFGESHGGAIGVVVDGVKPGIVLGVEDFMADILRRKAPRRGSRPMSRRSSAGCSTGGQRVLR